MEQIIINLIKLQNQIRILHWQTDSFARHEAFGKTYEALDKLIDDFVEVHQGKHGRLLFNSPVNVEINNIDNISIVDVLDEASAYLIIAVNETHDSIEDSDCLNIRDEILSVINKLKYLLTLN
jgi:DNA-binding ferritin-like protein